jgi:hypothetical protein
MRLIGSGVGSTTACHLPHQVDSHRRLNENYPAQLYASYNDETYGFCLGCHENLNKHLSKPKTSTDTAFRKIGHCFFRAYQGKMVNCVTASAAAQHIETPIKRQQ